MISQALAQYYISLVLFLISLKITSKRVYDHQYASAVYLGGITLLFLMATTLSCWFLLRRL